MKEIILYTDGACSGNPGKGGWAAILMYQNHKKELAGGCESTTNNRMELQAVIEGICALKQPCFVRVYSDSAYVINAFENSWLDDWQKNGWKTAGKKPVQNDDLWKQLLEAIKQHKLEWNKVKGHADNENNNRCDLLARKEIEKLNKI